MKSPLSFILKKKDDSIKTEKKRRFPHFTLYYIVLPILIYALIRNNYTIFNGTMFLQLQTLADSVIDSDIEQTDKAEPDIPNIGVRQDIVGMGYYNDKTKLYYGMEIDIAKEIARELGYDKVHFVPVSSENRVEALQNNEVDFVIASCTITDNPPEGLTYSQPYLNTHGKIMTQDSSQFTKLSDLNKIKMGVIEKGVNVNQAREYLSRRKIYPEFEYFRTYGTMFNAFFEGNIDAICVDEIITNMYREEYDYINYGLDINFIEFSYGILSEKNGPYAEKIDQALTVLRDEGTLDMINEKWSQN